MEGFDDGGFEAAGDRRRWGAGVAGCGEYEGVAAAAEGAAAVDTPADVEVDEEDDEDDGEEDDDGREHDLAAQRVATWRRDASLGFVVDGI